MIGAWWFDDGYDVMMWWCDDDGDDVLMGAWSDDDEQNECDGDDVLTMAMGMNKLKGKSMNRQV